MSILRVAVRKPAPVKFKLIVYYRCFHFLLLYPSGRASLDHPNFEDHYLNIFLAAPYVMPCGCGLVLADPALDAEGSRDTHEVSIFDNRNFRICAWVCSFFPSFAR